MNWQDPQTQPVNVAQPTISLPKIKISELFMISQVHKHHYYHLAISEGYKHTTPPKHKATIDELFEMMIFDDYKPKLLWENLEAEDETQQQPNDEEDSSSSEETEEP